MDCPKCHSSNIQQLWTQIIGQEMEIKYKCDDCFSEWKKHRRLKEPRTRKVECPSCKKMQGKEVFYRLEKKGDNFRAEVKYVCQECGNKWTTRIPSFPRKNKIKKNQKECPSCGDIGPKRKWTRFLKGEWEYHYECEKCNYKWFEEGKDNSYLSAFDKPAKLIVL